MFKRSTQVCAELDSLVETYEKCTEFKLYFEDLSEEHKRDLALGIDNVKRYLNMYPEVKKVNIKIENCIFTWCRQFHKLLKEFPNICVIPKAVSSVEVDDKDITFVSHMTDLNSGYINTCLRDFNLLKEVSPDMTKKDFYIAIFMPIAFKETVGILDPTKPLCYIATMYLPGKSST